MKIDYVGNEIPATVDEGGDGPVVYDNALVKRENQYVSARILDYDRNTNELTVDDPKIFHLKKGLQYRIYKRGHAPFARTYQDVYLAEEPVRGNTVKVKGSLSQYVFDEDLRIYGGTSNLWMGPKLFWIVLEALPFNSSDEKI